METRMAIGPQEAANFSTQELRDHFLIGNLSAADRIHLVYTHYDRMIVGLCSPVSGPIELPNPGELKAEYFLERRELGVINLGGSGKIVADGMSYSLQKLDCAYLGKGTKSVIFDHANQGDTPAFYLLSAPAHHRYENTMMSNSSIVPVELGEASTSNKRKIFKYIYPGGVPSCQLVMGLTMLAEGSVWNSMPPHTHTRRMEVYLYFDVAPTARVFHFMGEAAGTRHLVMKNLDAVLSPPWSTHFGCGTGNYGFVWGMAGENLEYTDMDPLLVSALK